MESEKRKTNILCFIQNIRLHCSIIFGVFLYFTYYLSDQYHSNSIKKEQQQQIIKVNNQVSQSLDILDIKTQISPDILKSNKNWIILGFTEFTYIPLAIKWYDQLTNLGYNNHFIVGLDTASEKYFLDTRNGQKTTPIRFIKSSNQIHKTKQYYLKTIWKTRLNTIQALLKQNYNILISDTDTIWLKYLKIDKEIQKIDSNSIDGPRDAYHSYAGKFPHQTLKAWNFTICGCFTAFKSTNNTLNFFEIINKQCKTGCDHSGKFERNGG